MWETVREVAYWSMLFVALNWVPARTTWRDRVMSLTWRKPRTDP